MSIATVLMERDGMTQEEADDRVESLREEMFDLISDGNTEEAYYIMEEVGLEPDYLEELIY
ncbi:MAG: hypothetical protein PHN69_03055 [Candidatus Pacebacteria bacterium]|nr:hypothetical protein [Candidatus Paceibacterota bacterium]